MGDRATLAKAKMELEELYLGVPDDSVNLTFQDLAQVRNNNNNNPDKKIITRESPIMGAVSHRSDNKATPTGGSSLAKLPSLDFSKGLEASSFQHHHHHHHQSHNNIYAHHQYHHHHIGGLHDHDHHVRHDGGQRSLQAASPYDDISHAMSGVSMSMSSVAYGVERAGGGRRRPGIPHSNICSVCCNYIYICRHRCLVCGRVYCRQCVNIGMGDMTEGRKCIECLGRRFSQRYIKKAGSVGWCCMGYPSDMKQRELKWAEKGPRRSGENKYNSVMVSRSRSPIGRASASPLPSRLHHPSPTISNPPSFVINSPYNSPRNQHYPMPF